MGLVLAANRTTPIMKHLVSLLLAIVPALLFVACDKTKEDVLPASFTKIQLENDYYTTQANTPVTLSVLENDIIQGPAEITFTNPEYGALQPASTPGHHVYQPALNFTGTDSIRYEVCIGQTCRTAWAIVNVGAI